MLITLEKLTKHFAAVDAPTAPIMLRFVGSDIEIPLDILYTRWTGSGALVTTLNTTVEDLEARIAEHKVK